MVQALAQPHVLTDTLAVVLNKIRCGLVFRFLGRGTLGRGLHGDKGRMLPLSLVLVPKS